jgi:hypothetical protein
VATPDEEALLGRWVHSHEEDSDDEMVFRPATHRFPPSRGRVSFELRPDGSYAERAPGPVDAPIESSGHWSLKDGRLLLAAEGEQPGHEWQVTASEPDRLALRRLP